MDPHRRSEEDLKRASGHLHYELWMLTTTAHKVDGLPLGTIEMTLYGEPQFNPDGSFTLK